MKVLFISLFALFGMQQDGKEVITRMHNKYAGKWHKTMTFEQVTGFYKNDSLVNTIMWQEALDFPGYLRIDQGDKKLGNSVIYTPDSLYTFRNGKKVRASNGKNDLIMLVGGMYFMPLDKVLAALTEGKYDLSKSFESTWKGRKMLVIGANSADEKVNQLWVDAEKLVFARMIKYDPGQKFEAHFEDHVKMGNAWIETNITFFVNDKLYQTELYKNIRPNAQFNKDIFDPAKFGTVSWY